ncbi:MAG: glycosyltransferase [Solirubrobacteraceae bacterium]
MNLCLICRNVESQSCSGLARATRDLARGLVDRGHRVSIVSGQPGREPVTLDGVVVIPVTPVASVDPESALGQMLHAAAVYRQVDRLDREDEPIDAVVAPLWRAEGAVCLLDERFPTIVSCMTSLITLTELDPAWRNVPDIAERLAYERAAMRRTRYLHGLTEAVLQKTVTDYEVSPDVAAVIGRGLLDRLANSSLLRPPAETAAPDDPLNVLFVGRLERRKGVDTLLAAARELIEDGVPLTLTLAGPNADPELCAAFERDVAELPAVRSSVRLTGAVSEAELHDLFRAADIVCAPSRYESHGVVLIEAMMFGKPIVTCAAGGIGEVVEASRNALVCPPDDPERLAVAIRTLAEDPKKRAAMGAAGRLAYERRFGADHAAAQMEAFLQRVLDTHRRTDRATAETVEAGVAGLAEEVFGYTAAASREFARELLRDPPPALPGTAQATRRRLLGAALRTPPRRHATAPGTPARVTAVVLSNDLPVLALEALESLARSGVPTRTLVLDNGSPPEAAAVLMDACAARDETELHRSDSDLGTAGGRRFAVERVDTEFVLFLDDDAELLPFALTHLVGELDAWPEAGAVTATVVNADGLVFHSGGSLRVTADQADFTLHGAGVSFEEATLPPPGPAGWVPGTAALIRRSLLDEFPIDTSMRAYYEDNEWCYRVAHAHDHSAARARRWCSTGPPPRCMPGPASARAASRSSCSPLTPASTSATECCCHRRCSTWPPASRPPMARVTSAAPGCSWS